MAGEYFDPIEKEKEFCKFIVSEYLKYGSVDELFRKNNYNLPISYPGVQRLLDKWGIIKAAGPNSTLSEAITFLTLLSDRKIPLERLYKSLPLSFRTSMGTMHRILHNIKEGIVRRVGTALVVTTEPEINKILVGEDISTPRLNLGKPFGFTSLPMGYSKQDESAKEALLRVLQQEVFARQAITRTLPETIIPNGIKPFMFLDIGDVRVACYHLVLPFEVGESLPFFSYKLINLRFINLSTMTKGLENCRAGIKEIGLGYQKYLEDKNFNKEPHFTKSFINLELAQPALEFVE